MTTGLSIDSGRASYEDRMIHGQSMVMAPDRRQDTALERCHPLVICGGASMETLRAMLYGPPRVGPPHHLGRRGAELASRLGAFRIPAVETQIRAEWEASRDVEFAWVS